MSMEDQLGATLPLASTEEQGANQGPTGRSWGHWLLVGFLCSCTVGPDYVAPEPETPSDWRNGERAPAFVELVADASANAWWKRFSDPVLDQLMVSARAANLDLEIALERVREARARRVVVAGSLKPFLSATANYTKNQDSKLFSAGFDATWEIDVFGGTRRAVEAQDAEVGATIESFRDVLVSLRAELALNYVETRIVAERLRIARVNVKAQESTLELVRSLVEAGLAPELDIAQAQRNLSTTRSEVPSLVRQLESTTNRIAVLIGEAPGAVHELLEEPQPIPVPPDDIAVGLPARLVRRRPDIRLAERRLAAQTARIGVTTAELYPRFALTGSLQGGATGLFGVVDAANRTWRYGPVLQWNILSFGRIRGQILAEESLTRSAYLSYRLTLLTALEETENALTAFAEDRKRRVYLERAERESARSVEMSKVLYREGLADFQTVLDIERSLFVLQEQIALNAGDITKDAISIYKAIGGAWSNDQDPVLDQTVPRPGGMPWIDEK